MEPRRDTVLFRPLGWFILRTSMTRRQAEQLDEGDLNAWSHYLRWCEGTARRVDRELARLR